MKLIRFDCMLHGYYWSAGWLMRWSLSAPHLCCNCMTYLPGTCTSFSNALTIFFKVCQLDRDRIISKDSIRLTQNAAKCGVHKSMNWRRWKPERWNGKPWILFPLTSLSWCWDWQKLWWWWIGQPPAWQILVLGGRGTANIALVSLFGDAPLQCLAMCIAAVIYI